MINITKQTFGENEKVLVKIKGDSKREIIQNFWLFVNRGCVKFKQIDDRINEIEDDTGFNWIVDDTEGYFRTNRSELIACLQSIILFRLLKEKDPNYRWAQIPPAIEKQSQELGLQWFAEIPEENVNYVDMDVENQ